MEPESETQVALEREKLQLEFQKVAIEREKLKLERAKGWLSALGIGVPILALAISYWFSSSADREKALIEQRKEAYVGYVSALDKDRVQRVKFNCDLEHDKLCQLRLEFEVQGGGYLRRIGLYGDPAVVSATAAYSREIGVPGGDCSEKTWRSDLEMYLAMRRNVLGNLGASEQDLALLVLPCKVPASWWNRGSAIAK